MHRLPLSFPARQALARPSGPRIIVMPLPPRACQDGIALLPKHFETPVIALPGRKILQLFLSVARETLLRYSWPDKVRQLPSAVELDVNHMTGSTGC